MKRIIVLVALALGILTSGESAQAFGNGPFGINQGGPGPFRGPLYMMFGKRPLPAFQAAPWYLYWPYNAHFMTPAPMGGMYTPPPQFGGAGAGGLVNPYFPNNQVPQGIPQVMPGTR